VDPVSENIWVFFGIAIVISFSGVMMPGPVLAATIAKGYKDERAGIKIALGHGLVEFPLMALIVLSFGYIFEDERIMLAIGLIGGALLVVMGAAMVRSRKHIAISGKDSLPDSAVAAGAFTTSANPYFFLWWATVGAVLILTAEEFGLIVIVVFAIVHWSCDLAWYAFTSFAVFRSKHLWTPLVHEVVFATCGLLMVAFGVYFIVGPITEMTG
jgi:threonine/homoserine/homoserine lactone efflux protein